MNLKRQLLMVALCFAMVANAQEVVQGLKLPRLTTGEREAMTASGNSFAKGQLIYNTTTNCLEYWNGDGWVSQCGEQKCGAFIAPGVWKEFMCYNLGVDNESADPFEPGQVLHGAMHKWGVKNPALIAAQNVTNSGAVSGWTSITPPPPTTDDWDMTTANPCPAGYRVPTKEEWEGVIDNNGTWTPKGTFSNGATNWTAGVQIGDGLFLPAAGYRGDSDGTLTFRGYNGRYWSSTAFTMYGFSFSLGFSGSTQSTGEVSRSYGYSVRCIAND